MEAADIIDTFNTLLAKEIAYLQNEGGAEQPALYGGAGIARGTGSAERGRG